MAFNGYLIKVGTYTVPLSFMRYESYNITHSTLDLDSYRNANGVLSRNALAHKVDKIEFNVPMMTMKEFQNVWANVVSHYSNATEKKINVNYYVPEIDDYVTADMYVPDIPFSIRNIDGNTINLNETRIAFIGY